MWLLKKLSDGTIRHLISDKKSYTIGRKNCDIIEEDPSISRKHCTIYIAKQNECPFSVNTSTGVWIVDEQSKYGTYLKSDVDWIKISPNQNKKLSSGSIIKFGLMDSVWSLEFKPFLVSVSGIPSEQKKKIEGSLQLIDGCLKNVWCKECSLLIVNEITLTVKVVLALIHGVPIVTPNYIPKLIESVKNQAKLPEYEDYRPDINEVLLVKSLVSLDGKSNRKELFKGKKFIIPTQKQLETLKEIILSAGGSIELFSSKGSLTRFADENVIVIQLPFNISGIPEDLVKSVEEITSLLKKKYGRRTIPESEIAQAVAYASIEKFCNPESNWFNLKIGERKQVDLGPVIVEETPLPVEGARHSSFCVVPSSESVELELSVPSNVESQSSANEIRKSQLNSIEKPGFVSFNTERKRTHSTDQCENELQKKKAKNEKIIQDKNKQGQNDKSIHENEIPKTKPNETETKCNRSKKNSTKSTLITNYFDQQTKPVEEKNTQSKLIRQNSSDFWNCNLVNHPKTKRKISSEDDDSEQGLDRKKAKLPKENILKQTMSEPNNYTPREVVKVVEPNKNFKQSDPFTSLKRNQTTEEENDFNGFFEKEKMDTIDDLNSTIFSLTLISPAYLNEDGSLIDPPVVPVNVKKFKKQKIFSSIMFASLEKSEDELLEGDWIEPHSDRQNISVA